jgi:hypothetical protein
VLLLGALLGRVGRAETRAARRRLSGPPHDHDASARARRLGARIVDDPSGHRSKRRPD